MLGNSLLQINRIKVIKRETPVEFALIWKELGVLWKIFQNRHKFMFMY